MDDQLVFRVTVLVFIVAGMAVGIPYRVRAARTGERISRRGEGPLIMVTLRLCGGLTMLCLVAFIVNPRWTAWAQMPLPDCDGVAQLGHRNTLIKAAEVKPPFPTAIGHVNGFQELPGRGAVVHLDRRGRGGDPRAVCLAQRA